MRGFEKRFGYIRCCLDSVDKQRKCVLYARGETEWCTYNRFGTDDICRCPEAGVVILTAAASDDEEVTL